MAFEFFSVPRIIVGQGTLPRLSEIAGALGAKALLVHNGTVAPRVIEILSQARVPAIALRQRGEPQINDIDAGVELAHRSGCDFVIGAGGGSAIDAAKAIAGMLTNGGLVIDYMEVVGKGQKITKPAAPWIAIPTTAGTGAEATRNAVIGWPEKKFKASIRSELLLPKVAIIDPELAVDVPPQVTARTGADALCQCIEAYVSKGANPLTDAVAFRGLGLAARFLKRVFDDDRDLEAREGMALGALFSGIALTNAGLGAVHGFAAPLGANFPVPHGTVCGVLLPHVIEANIAGLRNEPAADEVLAKYTEVGRALTLNPRLTDEQALDACAACAADLIRRLRLPPLKQFGVSETDVMEMVALARKSSSMRYNPVVLSDETLASVLEKGIV